MAGPNYGGEVTPPATPVKKPKRPASPNPLVDGDPRQTIENGRAVLAFIHEFHTRDDRLHETTERAGYGLWLVLRTLDEALRCAGEQIKSKEAA